MARLPTPGGDAGNWGEILNDYLEQAHDATGGLKDTGILASKYKKPTNGIPVADLEQGVKDVLATVLDHTTTLSEYSNDIAAVTTRIDGSLKPDGTLKDASVTRETLAADVAATVDQIDSPQLWDRFDRYADGVRIDAQTIEPLIGGRRWSATGAASPTVSDGLLVSSSLGYAIYQIDDPVSLVSVDVSYLQANPATATTTIAICKEGTIPAFGENMIHLNFGPTGGVVLIQQDDAAYQQIMQCVWLRSVAIDGSEAVRVSLGWDGDTVTVYGPYGEVFATTTPAVSAAMASGGNALFLQPGGGVDAGRFHAVTAFGRSATIRPAKNLVTPADGSSVGSIRTPYATVGKKDSVWQVAIGLDGTVGQPAIAFGTTVALATLATAASAGSTMIGLDMPLPSGSIIKIGNGAAQETRTTTGYSSGTSSPYIATITAGMTNGYPMGTPVIVTVPLAGRGMIYWSTSQGRMIIPTGTVELRSADLRLGVGTNLTLKAPTAHLLELGTTDSLKLDGAYNGGYIRLGANYIWADSSGRLRIKASAPNSDTDGTVVGSQS